jgi:tetratricopeptide (TPR) repeat protein
VINFMLNGTGGDATKHFRRAVTLDSNREHAWEMLVAISLAAERFDELLAVCVERVKVADTIRNRYILAKAHERLKQLDKVAEQLDIILKREPDNFAATAGMATVSLRRGDDAKADDWLARADKLATDLSADRQDSVPAEQRADLRALHAIRALLAGDRDAAELHLGHAFKLDSDNKNARAVMRTMGP